MVELLIRFLLILLRWLAPINIFFNILLHWHTSITGNDVYLLLPGIALVFIMLIILGTCTYVYSTFFKVLFLGHIIFFCLVRKCFVYRSVFYLNFLHVFVSFKAIEIFILCFCCITAFIWNWVNDFQVGIAFSSSSFDFFFHIFSEQ